jgi:low affinity Fe/Cu permease
MSKTRVRRASEIGQDLSIFDRFATGAAQVVGRATFFLFCVLLVVVWFPSLVLIHDVDTWQLIINTATTIITFLMVALLQNTQGRSDQALQHKLNAIAQGLSDLMDHHAEAGRSERLSNDCDELRAAVGLESHEGSSKRNPRADR